MLRPLLQKYNEAKGGSWCWLGRKSSPMYDHCTTCPIEPQYIEVTSAAAVTAGNAKAVAADPGLSGWYYWVPYSCHYRVLERSELVSCMNERQISKVGIHGARTHAPHTILSMHHTPCSACTTHHTQHAPHTILSMHHTPYRWASRETRSSECWSRRLRYCYR
jgi:hypothetical protein